MSDQRFNTGNPIGSNSPLDRSDNTRNLDVAVNAEYDTFQDRLGKSRLTWAGIVKAGSGDPAIAVDAAQRAETAADNAVDDAARAESAASQVQQDADQIAAEAAQQAVDGVVIAVDGAVDRAESEADRAEAAADVAMAAGWVYSNVAAGEAARVDGDYFWVVSTDASEVLELWLMGAVTATDTGKRTVNKVYVDAIRKDGKLGRNRGAAWPLVQRTINGVTSNENTRWSNFLLDCKVFGARDDEFFRFEDFTNETPYRFSIGTVDKETMTTTGIVMNVADTGSPTYDPNGGVQTLVFSPSRRPSLVFMLTVDANQAGTGAISSKYDTQNGYSYIIDPACHEKANPYIKDSRHVNMGKVFPFKKVSRNGVTTEHIDYLEEFIMDCKIYGAREGKYYRIGYFRNGSTGTGAMDPENPYGIQVYEHDAETYGSVSSDGAIVISWNDPIESMPEDGVLYHRIIESSIIDGLRMEITLYRQPSTGFVYILSDSWIIDPDNYFHAEQSTPEPELLADELLYSVDAADKTTTMTWKDGDKAYRIRIGPVGANNIPNISYVGFADVVNGVVGSFTSYYGGGTDWLPPLTLKAINNSDTLTGFTGGNHLINGQITAVTDIFDIQVDGVNLSGFDGETRKCSEVRIYISHRIMAANTVFDNRYVVRQSFVLTIRPSVVEVMSDVCALEEIDLAVDYGPQLTLNSIDSVLFLNGQYPARETWVANIESGDLLQYSDAWAAIYRRNELDITQWVDHDYGIGDGQFIRDDLGYSRIFTSSSKAYTGVVRIPRPEFILTAGQRYQWRGGYSFTNPYTNNVDCKFDVLKEQRRETIMAFDANNYVRL